MMEGKFIFLKIPDQHGNCLLLLEDMMGLLQEIVVQMGHLWMILQVGKLSVSI